MNPVIEDGPWHLGCDSVSSPDSMSAGHYQWLINGINKGGVISTRPGWRSIQTNSYAEPQGMTIFTPRGGVPHIVVAINGQILFNKFPFPNLDWNALDGISFAKNVPVNFETAVVGVIQDASGNITSVDPFTVLMMCDGISRTAFWDGVSSRHLDPTPTGEHATPICSYMKWIGNRLWTIRGKRVRVSNLLNPLKFTEEDILAEGGYFNLPDEGTGIGATPDFRSVIAFTDFTTTVFQAGILNRLQWQITPDFQKVLFSHIGCAAHRSIINQWGMVWWYSHNGLINLDASLQTYRSSQIRYQDQEMRRSQSNFADDISGICSAAYENYLLLSVPSGDLHNYHTWVLDGNPVESIQGPARWAGVWTGIRPVQFATAAINGKWRCFALSNEIPTSVELPSYANVWEMFLQDRKDVGHDFAGDPATKTIPLAFETKLFTVPNYSVLKYAELEISEISGKVHLDVYYAPKRGVYKKILSKKIVATAGSVDSEAIIPVTFEEYLPQRRYAKTVNESIISTDTNPEVETPFTRNKDRSFSLLIKWTGRAALTKVKIYTEPEPEQMDGTDEEGESTDRYITASGSWAILDEETADLPIREQQSGFLNVNSPRWSEDIYSSVTP